MLPQMCHKTLINLPWSTSGVAQIARKVAQLSCLRALVTPSCSGRVLPLPVVRCEPSGESLTTKRKVHSLQRDVGCSYAKEKRLQHEVYCVRYRKADRSLEDEYTTLANRIIADTRRVDIMVDTVPQADVVDLVCELCALDFEMKDIKSLLSRRLWLLRHGDVVVSIARLLQQHGLDAKVTFRLMERLPPHYSDDPLALARLPDVIDRFLMELRAFGVLEPRQIILLLARSPLVMLGEASAVPEAIEKMKEMFHVSQAKQMIVKCPNLLTDDWEELTEKYNYAMVVMGYHQKDIVKSALFAHTIEHIQDRHLFFLRTGNFFQVKPKDDPDLNPNPELKYLIDSNNENFVKHCGDIGIEQYLAFLEIREKERELEDDSDWSDDDV